MEANVIRYYRFGEPGEVLRIEKKSPLLPGPGELSVKMRARPINPSDVIPIRGAYAHRIALPAVPGYEGVGVVEAVGPGVPKQMLGMRVLPLQGDGTWQDYVTAPAKFAVPVPEDIDDDTACQLYINPVTAWLICRSALRLTHGDVLVVNAAGSAIGRIFAQLSPIFGYRMIALTRSERHTSELQRLGAAYVFNAAEVSVRDRILEVTAGQGATAAIDSIGGPEGDKLVRCVKTDGTILSIGLLSGIPAVWHEAVRGTQVQVLPFYLRQWVRNSSQEEWEAVFEQVSGLVREKKLEMMKIGTKFELTDAISAIRAAESGIHGKVLLLSP
ncbi:zinc-dependent alcohol dehydrogenase family protein [Paenibacillus tyrfis]|uniref:zinc-dependent alcohol dehydrogenase family protein n=1 Tax=Paenibacillus tyrfis TaxID=1501230 RepID=UPI0020A1C9B3|nr:zinc-dependent alcohol dehydrogenase family protein [Paenibacillus tyrfis]MCP1311949.1 zinc-dependent alcohol dehydrogenase family protein [Paenibacillus tyrfis]